ncbi:hypothetical protein Pcinc_033191 [Petrolisthes cinctipes]|uniref:Uncharacterized protein n=1 Tax=Petrolisthes cinctipes TaxID=88211 RepID=A0AAE1JZU8_PETCI|nr:hypothetical protein Pcinc_033191 [Petrolisthes cinctipes]
MDEMKHVPHNKAEKRPTQEKPDLQDVPPSKLLTTPRRSRSRPDDTECTSSTSGFEGETDKNFNEEASNLITPHQGNNDCESSKKSTETAENIDMVQPAGQVLDQETMDTDQSTTDIPSCKKKLMSREISSKIPLPTKTLKLPCQETVPVTSTGDKSPSVDADSMDVEDHNTHLVGENSNLEMSCKNKSIKDGDMYRSMDTCKEVTVEKTINSEVEKQQQAKCDNFIKLKDSTSAMMNTVEPIAESFGEGMDYGSGSSELNVKNDIQAEVEKVKKRRSTIGRASVARRSTVGGRQSMCSSIPVFSLEDQISRIDKNLPWASTLGNIVDISLREACRRLEARYPEDECVSDMRVDLLTRSETLGGEVAFKLSGRPLDLSNIPEPLPNKTTCQTNNTMFAAYKNKINDLEQEYRKWKLLMKERKKACREAEGEYKEAKSGLMKIYEDQFSCLTSVQRPLLASRPNYQQYIQELQTVREKAVLMLTKVKHTTVGVSRLLTASKLQAERSYNAIEAETSAHLKKKPVKLLLASLTATNTDSADI